jgi:hypothetical protein
VVETSAWPSSSCTVRMSYPPLQEVRRKAVAQHVWADGLRDSRGPRGDRNGPLDRRFMQVEPARRTPLGSRQIRAAGNTNCHCQAVAAFGYFRSSTSPRMCRTCQDMQYQAGRVRGRCHTGGRLCVKELPTQGRLEGPIIQDHLTRRFLAQHEMNE